MRRRLSICILLAIGGCVSGEPPPPIATPINTAELEFIKSKGTASIEGQAFARQRGGGVVTAAGENVYIVPATEFTRQLTDRLVIGTALATDSAAITPYQRVTAADADGRFRFADLPAGGYIVVTSVRWEVPSEYGPDWQGGAVKREVRIAAGEHATIILSR